MQDADRVLHGHRNPKQIEWARSFVNLLEELRKYVMQYHTTGLAWNAKVSSRQHSDLRPPPLTSLVLRARTQRRSRPEVPHPHLLEARHHPRRLPPRPALPLRRLRLPPPLPAPAPAPLRAVAATCPLSLRS